MKLRIILVVMFAAMLCALPASALEKAEKRIAMVLWRGETQSEAGLRAALSRSNAIMFRIDVYDAAGSREKLEKILPRLTSGHYDLIYTFGTTVTKAVSGQIKDIPIVFNVVARPVESGLIDSIAAPGRNMTGVSNAVSMDSAFKTISLIMRIRKLVFIYNPDEPNSAIQCEEIAALQKRFGYKLFPVPLRAQGERDVVLKKILDIKPDAVMLPSDSMVEKNSADILKFTNKHRMPSIVTIPESVRKYGALVAVGPDYSKLGTMAAESIITILGGGDAGRLPVKSDNLRLVVNMTTAKRLGINFPLQLVALATIVY